MIRDQGANPEIPILAEESDISTIIKNTNLLIDSFNFLSRYMSFKNNFDGQIIDISFTAGEEKVISHGLGVKPKHRIILNQEGNGVLSDVPSGWNKFQIKLKNNGAVSVTATVMIVKE